MPMKHRNRWSLAVRSGLLGSQQHRCRICTGPLSLLDAHLDHVVPLARGGADVISNLQLVHMNCNLRKGTRTTIQVAMPWA